MVQHAAGVGMQSRWRRAILAAGTAIAVLPAAAFAQAGAPSRDDLTIGRDRAHEPAPRLSVDDKVERGPCPLVDEPITGVGNDDLWQVKCDPQDANSSCPTEESTQ